ncbi:putative secreted protein with PEP-CTERM sorting signal [Nitrosospira sp. Nsp2]|uniref:PEP-CTERM sorting domain-containing protein n=1 Tax=Nitrosospira sp. Nsp2 TaxID=136548 RepID=UPI000D4F46AF|nr:PEP-CTERM sorting domain-containing protein [Nitrosospira sp. Nsp2]PTR16034.1 putative secreted protein with PEP-CTERM sorting signal [Nitrosospira sp. Nsp2]
MNMKKNGGFKVGIFVLGPVLLAVLSIATHADAEILYFMDLNKRTVSEIKTFGGFSTFGGINNAGQVVGGATTPEGGHYAFLTGPSGQGIRNLGSLGGNFSRALGINDSGEVVGFADTATGARRAFMTGPNGVGMRDLGTLGRDQSVAEGINNTGQVVGYTQTDTQTGSDAHAFITGPGGEGIRDLDGTSGGATNYAFAINDAGQVLGLSVTSGGDFVSFITGPNGAGTVVLGTFGGRGDVATDINASGQVAGGAGITGPNGMGMTTLGTLGASGTDVTDAEGLNDAGQVVGSSSTSAGATHAFVTGPDGAGMTDLNSLDFLPEGVLLTAAMDINNAGQIIATGVPEPESYLMLLAGLGMVVFAARRKRPLA